MMTSFVNFFLAFHGQLKEFFVFDRDNIPFA